MMTNPCFAEQLAVREEIRHRLAAAARGADRLDGTLIGSAFWPDATIEQIGYSGPADAYIPFALAAVGGMEQTMHMLGNILIDVAGEEATSEAYLQAFHRIKDEAAGSRDLIIGGRYVDRWDRRGSEWRISARVLFIDWFRHFPDSADWSAGILGLAAAPAGRGVADESAALLSRIGDIG